MDEVYQPVYVEDLDLGFRAWQQSWPSVFVAGAHTVHKHRATTSRYFTRESLERLLELHYFVFWPTPSLIRAFLPSVDRSYSSPKSLEHDTASEPKARAALAEAWRAPFWVTRPRMASPQ